MLVQLSLEVNTVADLTSVAVPAIKTAAAMYSSRKMIFTNVYKLVNFAISSKIVVTGMAGAGKSYLFDFINQTVKNVAMTRPSQSVKGEEHFIYMGNGLFPKKITVIPGQEMAISLSLMDKELIKNNKINGIIHVLDYGHNAPRDEYTASNYEADNIYNFKDLISHNKNAELIYLEGIVSRISSMPVKPKWFCLVLTKTDLYKASEAKKEYLANEKFIKIIEKLESIFGKERLAILVPVCSDISSITYGSYSIHPKFVKTHKDSTALLMHLFSMIQMLDN